MSDRQDAVIYQPYTDAYGRPDPGGDGEFIVNPEWLAERDRAMRDRWLTEVADWLERDTKKWLTDEILGSADDFRAEFGGRER